MIKRLFDIIFSLFGLILVSPLFLVIAVLIMVFWAVKVDFLGVDNILL